MTDTQSTPEFRRAASLAEVRRLKAELEPYVREDVKRATRILIDRYAEDLRLLADQ